MTTKHTPGPWTLDDRGYKFIVHKPGDGYITRDVCRMDSSTMAAFAQEANARLIAAAPDLLEALRSVWLWMEDQADGQSKGGHATFDMMLLMEQRDIARSAIAKATGE